MIPYGKQSIDADDIAAVVRVLESDYLTTGPEVALFEAEFAAMVGAKHAVAVASGTAALHLAMLVAGVGSGDRVLTTPYTFLASANAAAMVGAVPDFCDIEPETFNLCPRSLAENWQDDVRAVVAVDYAGRPANMPAIAGVAREHGAVVIEDACHGIGSQFFHHGEIYSVGGQPWADITTYSFHPVKTMTTGEGGMLVTDNEEYAERARLLRSHGITRDHSQFSVFVNPSPITDHRSPITESGPWTYEMQALGYNFRITDIQCALGRSQLKKLPQFIRRRQEIVDRYNSAFRNLSWLRTPKSEGYGSSNMKDGEEKSQVSLISSDQSKRISDFPYPETPRVSWHLYSVQIYFDALGKTRTEVMNDLREQGIGTQVHYIPVYLQPWYQETFGYKQRKCPNAESCYRKALSLPLYPAITDDDVASVIRAVRKLASHP